MKQYCLDLLVVGQAKWTGSGLEKLDNGYTLASSRDRAAHGAGHGI